MYPLRSAGVASKTVMPHGAAVVSFHSMSRGRCSTLSRRFGSLQLMTSWPRATESERRLRPLADRFRHEVAGRIGRALRRRCAPVHRPGSCTTQVQTSPGAGASGCPPGAEGERVSERNRPLSIDGCAIARALVRDSTGRSLASHVVGVRDPFGSPPALSWQDDRVSIRLPMSCSTGRPFVPRSSGQPSVRCFARHGHAGGECCQSRQVVVN